MVATASARRSQPPPWPAWSFKGLNQTSGRNLNAYKSSVWTWFNNGVRVFFFWEKKKKKKPNDLSYLAKTGQKKYVYFHSNSPKAMQNFLWMSEA